MKILLKDPTKVDAVIKKIDDTHPLDKGCKKYISYYIEAIKKRLEKGCEVILDVDFKYSKGGLRSYIFATPFYAIHTDEQFLKLK